MPMFNRCRKPDVQAARAPRLAFAVTVQDLQALERITGHARIQLVKLGGDMDRDALDRASGYWLMLALSERAGAARVLGRPGIPMLVDEVGVLEAVVLNLQSYGGDDMAVVEGHDLLARVTVLAQLPCHTEEIGGVLALPDTGEPSPN
ncbi:hypothetical protein B9W64_37890 [Streptomyces sp. CS159]|uniref:hypothetical protein n=1 Tax=Streptomyces sp. CS159 TaxID=1982762 RepID=UPI000B4195FC|nr:hypothetical protein [Streptomyces sp. CS159]OVZ99568.1 hypothetical protein B9W64_37890 [Streptomyces sp. CS159]